MNPIRVCCKEESLNRLAEWIRACGTLNGVFEDSETEPTLDMYLEATPEIYAIVKERLGSFLVIFKPSWIPTSSLPTKVQHWVSPGKAEESTSVDEGSGRRVRRRLA